MASNDTAPGAEACEGQDHDETEVPSRGEIRLHRAMRLLFGLAVPAVAVVGLVRIAEAGNDPMEVITTILAIATTALGCAYAGARATQLQTDRDEAIASPDHD